MRQTSDDSQTERTAQTYIHRCQQFRQEQGQHDRLARRISTARLVVFLGATAALISGVWGWHLSSPAAVAAGAVGWILFAGLVFWHDRVLHARDRAALLLLINEEALNRLRRVWDQLPLLEMPLAFSQSPLAKDLDLFPSAGRSASITQLLGPVNSTQGRTLLAHWLVHTERVDQLSARQAAVAELAPLLDFRQELDQLGRPLRENPQDPQRFLEWTEGPRWLSERPVLLWACRGLAVAATAVTTLTLLGLAPVGWMILLLGFNLTLSFWWGRSILATFDSIAGRRQALRHYARLFRHLDQAQFTSDQLRGLHARLRPHGRSVAHHMHHLDRLSGLADARLTPLFHLPLAALTLWDFHVLWAFEKWQQTVGPHVRAWFQALGEAEALSALASLSHDHPEWTFPSVHAETTILEAEALGHPLLPPPACVTNDVTVGPPGSFLLVTGSNMSGKSTLLRALGANVVLAQAGGPVCARRLSLPPLVVGTSFRVDDSLEAGVSLFMAELKRLKDIVELARETQQQGHARCLFLLDEILQGTNVAERQIAVRRVIENLLRSEALGAVSTHDLTLAEAPDLADHCVATHFSETYETQDGRPHMSFDYQLRPGVASTRNALKLLELVGLTEAD